MCSRNIQQVYYRGGASKLRGGGRRLYDRHLVHGESTDKSLVEIKTSPRYVLSFFKTEAKNRGKIIIVRSAQILNHLLNTDQTEMMIV